MNVKKNEKTIFNPLSEDFEYTYNSSGQSQTYVLHGLETGTFPTHIDNKIKKHLSDKILHKRGITHTVEYERNLINKEIETDV